MIHTVCTPAALSPFWLYVSLLGQEDQLITALETHFSKIFSKSQVGQRIKSICRFYQIEELNLGVTQHGHNFYTRNLLSSTCRKPHGPPNSNSILPKNAKPNSRTYLYPIYQAVISSTSASPKVLVVVAAMPVSSLPETAFRFGLLLMISGRYSFRNLSRCVLTCSNSRRNAS